MEEEIINKSEEMPVLPEQTEEITEEPKERVLTLEEIAEEEEIQRLRNSPEAKWYVVHTYVGYENVAKDNLAIVVEKFNLRKRIFDIIIPTEEVIEEKNGKKKLVSKKLTPNYIFVKMIYGDDLWHNVTRTRGITGFTGPKGRPLEITEEEIRKMKLERKLNTNIIFNITDKVEVVDGPLSGMIGSIQSTDVQNHRAKVDVEMFGRATPVDLDFSQIRKVD